ncbi:response regulator [Dyadobacter sp. CY312]|nr:response regulator [Dyadobacter sp. CY312]
MEIYYDLILMDIQMPVMDGFTSSVQIRKLPNDRFQILPIIALTASPIQDVRGSIAASGMTDYISKPFSISDLYLKITQYLN